MGGCLISWKEIIEPFGYKPYHRGEDFDLLERLYEKGKLRSVQGIKPVIHVCGSQGEKGKLSILYEFISSKVLRLFWEMQGKYHKAYWSKAYSQKVTINLDDLLK